MSYFVKAVRWQSKFGFQNYGLLTAYIQKFCYRTSAFGITRFCLNCIFSFFEIPLQRLLDRKQLDWTIFSIPWTLSQICVNPCDQFLRLANRLSDKIRNSPRALTNVYEILPRFHNFLPLTSSVFQTSQNSSSTGPVLLPCYLAYDLNLNYSHQRLLTVIFFPSNSVPWSGSQTEFVYDDRMASDKFAGRYQSEF